MFFMAMVFFAVAFVGGFFLGYKRGIVDQPLAAKADQAIEAQLDGIELPETLLEDAPRPTLAPVAATGIAEQPMQAMRRDPPPASVSASDPRKPKPFPTQTTAETARPAETAPKPRPPAPDKAPSKAEAKADSIANGTHVQVAAVRVRGDAQMLAGKLAAKGYPAVVYSGGSDRLHRVILGPFRGRDDAKAAQEKLKGDGLESLIRVR